MAARMYATIPVPAQHTRSAHANLTIVGSIPMYSAIPAHTPQSFLSLLLYNLLLLITTPSIKTINTFSYCSLIDYSFLMNLTSENCHYLRLIIQILLELLPGVLMLHEVLRADLACYVVVANHMVGGKMELIHEPLH